MIIVSESGLGLGRVTAVRADTGPAAAQQREGAAALMTEIIIMVTDVASPAGLEMTRKPGRARPLRQRVAASCQVACTMGRHVTGGPGGEPGHARARASLTCIPTKDFKFKFKSERLGLRLTGVTWAVREAGLPRLRGRRSLAFRRPGPRLAKLEL
jgi:hypothetical protein